MQEKRIRKPWTAKDEGILLSEIRQHPDDLSACFMAVARQTGRTARAVSNFYYKKHHLREDRGGTPIETPSTITPLIEVVDDEPEATETPGNKGVKWAHEEDIALLNQIRCFPTNLKRCFQIIAEQLDRTPCGVASHWYASLSKKEWALCFLTISPQHVCKNRKNGVGERSNTSVWNKILTVLGLLQH